MNQFQPLDGNEFVRVAREYIGTPWVHDARLKGVGVDCVGLIVCALAELGVDVPDERGYSRDDEFDRMTSRIEAQCTMLLDHEASWPGDLVVFRGPRITNHVGIYTDTENFIHAWNSPTVSAVVEMPFDAYWTGKIHSRWSYRGLTSKP